MRPSKSTFVAFVTFVALIALGAMVGCSSSSSPANDTLAVDAIIAMDHHGDILAADSLVDAQAADTFSPLAGLGTIAGACGVLDEEEWQSSAPFFFRNTLDFGSEVYAVEKLSAGGQQIISDENLGGGSLLSEAFSFEVLHRCELATLLKTERSIEYRDADGKKTDLLLSIDARDVGVSVTRAYHYPPDTPYTDAEARVLLEDKLPEVLLSADNARPTNAWQRSILHILAYNAQYADAVQRVYEQLDAATRDRTIVIVTVTEGDDAHLY